MSTAEHPVAPITPARRGMRFFAFAAAVVAGNALLVGNYQRFAEGPAPEWPVMVDLLLLVPLVYLALNWRQGRQAVYRTLALAGLGAVAVSLILPAESKDLWLVAEDFRFAVLAVVLLCQMGVIALVVSQLRSAHQQNPEIVLNRIISERYGTSAFARLLALESRVWLYGLSRHAIRHPFPGTRHFHVGKQGMNASNQAGFLIIIGAEIPLMHFVIHLFDPWIATVVTALSAYGFVFMLAEYRAALHRPLSVTARGLQLRYGVASDFLVEWSSIVGVEPVRAEISKARARRVLTGMGEANLVILLKPGTYLEGLAGSQLVEQIHLGVDDPTGLAAEIRAHSQLGLGISTRSASTGAAP